jgi:nucleophosmin 3
MLIIKHYFFYPQINFIVLLHLQVETKTEKSTIKIPIAVLKVGESRCSQSFLEFPEYPVTFRLIQGSGPIHIHGHHLIGEVDAELGEEEMDDIEDEEEAEAEEIDDEDQPKAKKTKLNPQNKGAKNNEKNNKKK